MMGKKIRYNFFARILTVTLIGGLSPGIVFADTACGTGDVEAILGCAIGLLNRVIPVIMALALVAFLWGLAVFMLEAGDESAQKRARLMIAWGVLGLFVMFSVWGLVNVLLGTFTLRNSNEPHPRIGS